MPQRRAHLSPESTHGELAEALRALREEYEVPDEFPADVLAEASAAAQEGPPAPALDLREVPFVTLDPAGSRDLDQAFHLERHNDGGFTLRYAIADVPGFVRPGGAIDREARLRGQTLYLPDGTVPLHPPLFSEDRVSLLPHLDRTAYVWTVPVDAAGAAAFEGGDAKGVRVERALIRSRAKLSYEDAQDSVDEGAAPPEIVALREFGLLRLAQERRRGGASLNMPDEEVVRDSTGYRIERRLPLAVEDWNAQLSLLTGMAAGHLMLEGGVGILRTMPAPDRATLDEFRARVGALGCPWPTGMQYGEYLDSVPRDTPVAVAVLHAAASLFRGADYTVFGVPDESGSTLTLEGSPVQSAIAAPYAHVTAPLRRLVDRWGLVICEALCSGEAVPEWIGESLAELPAIMRASAGRAGRLSSESLDRVEAALLRDHVGTQRDALVVEASNSRARVQLDDPPVTANALVPEGAASPAPGTHARVDVRGVTVSSGEISLEVVPR